jgi:Tfp pilus assembly PilM family ATPase
MAKAAGIDIGADTLKAIVLKKRQGRPVEVVSAGSMPLGELGHMEDSQDKTLAVDGKLKELVKKVRVCGNSRCVGILGKHTTLRYLQVPPVPSWRLEMLVKYEIEEKMGEKESSSYDYRTLDLPESGGQDTVLIGAVKDTAVVELIARGREAGLGGVEIDLEALGLYNAYYYGHGFDTDKTVLVVDIGADDVIILLCRNGMLYLIRSFMGGGRRVTQVLADKLKVELPEAEEIKKNKGEIVFDLQPGRSLRAPAGRAAAGTSAGAAAPAAASVHGDAGPQVETLALEKSQPETLALQPLGAKTEAETAPTPAPAKSQFETLVLQPLGAKTEAEAAPPPEAQEASPPASEEADAATALVNLQLDAAEKQKRQMSALGMSAALVPEAASLCAVLENAVHYCRQQLKQRELKVDRVYVSGGGSKLKGLLEFMSRRMRIEVLPLEPLKNISLNRLPAEQAEALKAEQHSFAVAIGLALGKLERGAFSFLFLPDAVRRSKLFWARGAYLHYAAALVAFSIGLFLFTPYRNTEALDDNNERALAAVKAAQGEEDAVKKLKKENDEKRMRLKQVHNNVRSGQYFLNLLAELKNPSRISPDVYLSSISTSMPPVVAAVGGVPDAAERRGSTARKDEDDSFLTQKRLYLRGFVRGDDQAALVDKVEKFKQRLVPHPENPNDPANLFKYLRSIWMSPEVVQLGQFYLYEFVLLAYTETDETSAAKADKAKAAAAATPPTPAAPGAPPGPRAFSPPPPGGAGQPNGGQGARVPGTVAPATPATPVVPPGPRAFSPLPAGGAGRPNGGQDARVPGTVAPAPAVSATPVVPPGLRASSPQQAGEAGRPNGGQDIRVPGVVAPAPTTPPAPVIPVTPPPTAVPVMPAVPVTPVVSPPVVAPATPVAPAAPATPHKWVMPSGMQGNTGKDE